MNFMRKMQKGLPKLEPQAAMGSPHSFSSAVEAFHRGDLTKAQSICKKILGVSPDDPQSWHLLGLIAHKGENFELSVKLFTRAINISPKYAQFYLNRGVSCDHLGDPLGAISDFDAALKLKPKYRKALLQKAKVLAKLNRVQECSECHNLIVSFFNKDASAFVDRAYFYMDVDDLAFAEQDFFQARKITGRSRDISFGLGKLYLKKSDFTQALQNFDDAISIDQKFYSAHLYRGDALQALERYHEAVESYKVAIDIEPMSPYALNNLGNALNKVEQYQDAITILDLAISLKPDFAASLASKATALKGVGQENDALQCLEEAARFEPESAIIQYNLGNLLTKIDQDRAMQAFDKAIALNPNYHQAYNNKGNLLRRLGRFDESLIAHDHALQIEGDASMDKEKVFAKSHYNRANVLQDMGRTKESIASYRKAIDLNPNLANAHWNLSLILLRLGKFEEGWQRYEWRWKRKEFTSPNRGFDQPLWLGQDSLDGKTILIHAEQGLGDSIQFLRYVAQVSELANKVVIEVPKPLLTLFSDFCMNGQLVERGFSLPHFDYHCPFMSLPLALNARIDNIPLSNGYLVADEEKITTWKKKLSRQKRLRVGLVWSGSEGHQDDAKRSLSLSRLTPLLSDQLEWVSLQKEVRSDDQETLSKFGRLQHFGDRLDDFSDTAALCSLMDLVISVDTSVAHLAGAMGKKTWLLIGENSDFRWLENRVDTPWYDKMRLFRQKEKGDWDSVIHALSIAIKDEHLV